MKVLLFSGSLRKDSLNKKLLLVVSSLLKETSGWELQTADLKSLSIPVYDGDIENEGIPEGVQKLGQLIKEADALICCTPEYNGSIAGPFKNAIDWVSRLRPQPLENKFVLLAGASPSGFGAIRGLGASRAPFEVLGAYVYPQPFALSKADEAFDSEGRFKDEGNKKKLQSLLAKFHNFSKELNSN